MGIVLGLAVLWIVALWYSGSFTQTQSPNLLIAGCAGGVEGWLLWRLVGRTWDRTTRYWALAIGAGMPLVAGLILLAKLLLAPSIMDESLLAVLIRLVAAIVISTFFAWMFATQPRR